MWHSFQLFIDCAFICIRLQQGYWLRELCMSRWPAWQYILVAHGQAPTGAPCPAVTAVDCVLHNRDTLAASAQTSGQTCYAKTSASGLFNQQLHVRLCMSEAHITISPNYHPPMTSCSCTHTRTSYCMSSCVNA